MVQVTNRGRQGAVYRRTQKDALVMVTNRGRQGAVYRRTQDGRIGDGDQPRSPGCSLSSYPGRVAVW